MNKEKLCGFFLLFMLTGCYKSSISDAEKNECSRLQPNQVTSIFDSYLIKKFPSSKMEVDQPQFQADPKNPFWTAKAIISTNQNTEKIFVMYFCGRGVEHSKSE